MPSQSFLKLKLPDRRRSREAEEGVDVNPSATDGARCPVDIGSARTAVERRPTTRAATQFHSVRDGDFNSNYD